MKNSTKVIIGVVAAVVTAVLVTLFFIGKTQTIIYNEGDERSPSTCAETDVKYNAIGDVFTCIDGVWVYTGSVTDYKG